MNPDPKWLEILNGSDVALAGFIACGLFLLANHLGWLPSPLSWTNPLLWVCLAFFFFGSHFAVKLLGAILTGLTRL